MLVDPASTDVFDDDVAVASVPKPKVLDFASEAVEAGTEEATDKGVLSDNRPARTLSVAEEELVLVEGA